MSMKPWLLVAALSASAAHGVEPRFRWEPATPVVGEQVDLVVEAEDAEALYGVQLQLAYAPQALAAARQNPVQAGALVASGASLTLRNAAEPRTGSITWVYSRMRPDGDVRGSGELARVRFTPLVAGQTRVEVSELKLASASGKVTRLTVPHSPTVTVYTGPEAIPETRQVFPHTIWLIGGAMTLAGVLLYWRFGRRKLRTEPLQTG